jgi:hypothetical protein
MLSHPEEQAPADQVADELTKCTRGENIHPSEW